MNSFVKAKLVSKTHINIILFTDVTLPNNLVIKLFKNDVEQPRPTLIKKTSNGNIYFLDINIDKEFDFSARYYVSVNDYPLERVDVSSAVESPVFDEVFYYDGDDLGAIYSKESTKFAVWAPLATSVVLNLENEDGTFSHHKMKRTDKGVHRVEVKGDLLNKKYRYRIEQCGVKRETNDIYGKGTSLNSEYSVVVDQDKIFNYPFISATRENELLKSVIYETNVRDFTESKGTDIEARGKYLGFVEPGRKTKKGNPAGLDYLKHIGITHVQLNPILDFRGVDDLKVSASYNWGYDPISLFAIEGSYSSNPEDGMSRILEFQEMVNELHKNNIRVVVDVVYNHIYEWQSSVLEKTVPGYFFKRNKRGQITSCSGCGNDINSNRSMVRKLIVDSARYLVKAFNIDGFRFDLMGLLDVDTLLELEKECRKVKNDLIFYGEGWNMPIDIPFETKACSENADRLPNFAFFNDAYRDIVKGPTFSDKIRDKGYINGNVDYHFGADYAMHGTVLNHSYAPKFHKAHQSLNYIECHDNNTLFDKLCLSNAEEDEDMILRRIVFANAFLLFSFGVPFVHQGQEIGLSKGGHPNTYNEVKINNMRWDLVDERMEMVNQFKAQVYLRLNSMPYLFLDDPKDIEKVFTVTQWDNGVMCLESTNKELLKDYSKIMLLVNPTAYVQTYTDEDYMSLLTLDKKYVMQTRNGLVPPTYISVYYKK